MGGGLWGPGQWGVECGSALGLRGPLASTACCRGHARLLLRPAAVADAPCLPALPVQAHLKWRADNGVDTILEDFHFQVGGGWVGGCSGVRCPGGWRL